MKKKEPRSLQDILSNQPNSLFARLADQRANNDTLLTRIRAVLSSHFAQHLVAVIYREEILVLVADSPAWANRIRFESENLRQQLIGAGDFAEESELQSDEQKSVKPVLRKIVTRTAASEISLD